jgi:putative glycosyltransferase (TIGR04372 family)
MIFRKLRKFLKPKLKRHPIAFRLYEAISWALTRSTFGPKHFFPTIVAILFPMWIAPRARLALHYVGEGKFDKAISIADDVLARKPEAYLDDDTFNRLAVAYSLEGRTEDLRQLFDRTEDRRSEIARELQYDRLGLRFFPKASFSNIGPLGLLDTYVKAQSLGVIPHRTNVILCAPEESHNPAYVRYWKKYFSLVTHPRTIELLAPLSRCLEERSNQLWCGPKGMRNVAMIGRVAQLQWEAEGRGPLLQLSNEHRERGYLLLREIGVPEGTWFVGLHVREGSDRLNLRNADIGTYRLAIEDIAKRGGWVLRMGDSSMRPLPSWPNTIDYAHSARREDWMDIFLWAEGRFFIGTGSGPQLVPPTFGKPVAIANYGPIATIVSGKHDILLPKQYWSEKEGRYLMLAERMRPEYAFLESIPAFAKFGIRIVDNTPEELRELVSEMIDRLEGRHVDTEQERAMQLRFAELAATHQFYPVKIARALMSRHPDVFQKNMPIAAAASVSKPRSALTAK